MSVAAHLGRSETARAERPAWISASAGLAVAGLLVTLAPDLPQPLRGLSAPVAFVAPGYGLLAVALRLDDRLTFVLRLALSVMLSLAVIALATVAVDPLVARLDAHTFAHTVGGLILAFAALVALERAPGTAAGRAAGAGAGERRTLLGLGGLVAVTVGIVAASITLLPSPARIPYFRFGLDRSWLGLDRTVEPIGRTLTVDLALKNSYPRARTYTIVPSLKGAGPWTRKTITIPADGRWQGTISGPVPDTRRCFNRMGVALRADDKTKHIAVLTLYVTGSRSFCPSLPVTRR